MSTTLGKELGAKNSPSLWGRITAGGRDGWELQREAGVGRVRAPEEEVQVTGRVNVSLPWLPRD